MITPGSRPLSDDERAHMHRWLENWQHIGDVLEQERRQRLAGLTDENAWLESQGLLEAWEPAMKGDSGEGLLLHQNTFARWRDRKAR